MHSTVQPLACFSEFYEQLAAIKQASKDKKLSGWLAARDQGTDAAQVPGRVQAWLLLWLERQDTRVAALASAGEMRGYRITQKIMAAVADECLLIDLPWEGSDAWNGLLLEARLFGTRSAGTDLFELADQLRAAPALTALHRELATVLLLALRLGFRGKLRGHGAERTLQRYLAELGRLSGQASTAPTQAFAQAYCWCVQLAEDRRMGPMAPWLRSAKYGLVSLLVLSGACWVMVNNGVLNQLERLVLHG